MVLDPKSITAPKGFITLHSLIGSISNQFPEKRDVLMDCSSLEELGHVARSLDANLLSSLEWQARMNNSPNDIYACYRLGLPLMDAFSALTDIDNSGETMFRLLRDMESLDKYTHFPTVIQQLVVDDRAATVVTEAFDRNLFDTSMMRDFVIRCGGPIIGGALYKSFHLQLAGLKTVLERCYSPYYIRSTVNLIKADTPEIVTWAKSIIEQNGDPMGASLLALDDPTLSDWAISVNKRHAHNAGCVLRLYSHGHRGAVPKTVVEDIAMDLGDYRTASRLVTQHFSDTSVLVGALNNAGYFASSAKREEYELTPVEKERVSNFLSNQDRSEINKLLSQP